MAASIALHLSRHRFKSPNLPSPNPSFVHLLSTSSSPSPPPSSTSDANPNSNGDSTQNQNQNQNQSQNPFPSSSSPSSSSFFSDVKASLREQMNQKAPSYRSPPTTPRAPLSSSSPPSPPSPNPKAASLEEIRRNLSEYRRNTSPPQPSSPGVSSFRDLYKANAMGKSNPTASPRNKVPGLSFEAIKESLNKLRNSSPVAPGTRGTNPLSLSGFRDTLKLRPSDPDGDRTTVIGSGSAEMLPVSVFGKELREKKQEEEESGKGSTELWKIYSFAELGEKLRKLRPEGAMGKKNGFSLGELNERLVKLRELEQKESESNTGGTSFKDLRESLVKLRLAEEEKSKKSNLQRLDIMGQMNTTPDFMLKPPKDELVEKYFHPDNMSSGEKMKIELRKVREEFKMSESDCGSARVQVAQLTTKIKHLSSVLHKKDKHSRRGLEGMVQKRKKLLKYLRRTDWDSYCFVLSKLGLRDSPDLRH